MTHRLGAAERNTTSAEAATFGWVIARAGAASIGLMGGPTGPAASGCCLAMTRGMG